jgi:hypothetical protein
VLEDGDRDDLQGFGDRLLLSEGELKSRVALEGKAQGFWTPELDGAKEYHDFVRMLHDKNMLYYSFSADCQVGIFAVPKKSGQIRLIVDCRSFNQRLRSPPRTKLATSGAVSEIHLDGQERLTYACHDV